MEAIIIEKVKSMTLQQLITNMNNDLAEDGDTGFNTRMTIEEYLTSLFIEE